MSTKAENMGCESDRESCEHYLPGEGKMIDGVMKYPGIGNVPTLGGRCMKASRVVARMDSCPVTGKLAKKLTKVERFGCLKCENYRMNPDNHTPFCQLAGQYAAINALHECPKGESKKIEKIEKQKIEEYRCGECSNLGSGYDHDTCMKARHFIFDMSFSCPGRESKQQASPSQANEKLIGCVGEDCENYAKGDGALSTACMLIPTNSSSLRILGKCPELYPDRPQKAPQEKKIALSQPPTEEEAPKEESVSPPAPPINPQWRILTIDASTSVTGWALREGDQVTEHGSIKAKDADAEKRKEIMRKGIIPFLDQPLHYVIIERSFVAGSGNVTRLLCELQGIIKNICHRIGHRLLEPSPTTWRSICPGSGRCDKDAAIEYARLRGYVFESPDEAEAICMALSFGPKLIEILSQEKEKKNGKKSKDNNGSGEKLVNNSRVRTRKSKAA